MNATTGDTVTAPTAPPIRWLGEADCCDPAQVGGKAGNLSRLARSYPVPPGFCLTADALAQRRQADYRDALLQAYATLEERVGQSEPGVAVRSSGIDEDGQSASFAGQYETFLNVRGPGAVLAAVDRCLQSGFAQRRSGVRVARGKALSTPMPSHYNCSENA